MASWTLFCIRLDLKAIATGPANQAEVPFLKQSLSLCPLPAHAWPSRAAVDALSEPQASAGIQMTRAE